LNYKYNLLLYFTVSVVIIYSTNKCSVPSCLNFIRYLSSLKVLKWHNYECDWYWYKIIYWMTSLINWSTVIQTLCPAIWRDMFYIPFSILNLLIWMLVTVLRHVIVSGFLPTWTEVLLEHLYCWFNHWPYCHLQQDSKILFFCDVMLFHWLSVSKCLKLCVAFLFKGSAMHHHITED
jgi:hypothetical protein